MNDRPATDPGLLSRTSRRSPFRALRLVPLSAALGLLLVAGEGALAQSAPDDDLRVGIGVTAGGIGLVGLSVELRWGNRSIDTNLATFAFRDVSLAVTGKQYFGGGDVQPFVGVGLWGVAARPEDVTERGGRTLLLRLPAGADWNVSGDHYLGASLALNEGLWIRRGDPTDDTPIGHRPVPLPGFYYRVTP